MMIVHDAGPAIMTTVRNGSGLSFHVLYLLPVTVTEYTWLAAHRADWRTWTREIVAPGHMYVSGMAVTGQEARLIAGGADPRSVLMPTVWVRLLTAREMAA